MQATKDTYEMLHNFVALKRLEPGDDLTTELITTRDDDVSTLTERELTDTLLLVIAAGYETTINLLDSAVTALSRLFTRFPNLSLAVPPSDLHPLPSILGNGHKTLPVNLGRTNSPSSPASS